MNSQPWAYASPAALPDSTLLPSLPLSPHSAYIVRELRIKAYNQLLASYASLSLDALAQAFGVSKGWVETCVPLFCDRCPVLTTGHHSNSDLARFTSTARIHCTIDSVNGIVSTTRPSVLTSQFEQVIKVSLSSRRCCFPGAERRLGGRRRIGRCRSVGTWVVLVDRIPLCWRTIVIGMS